MIFNLENNYTYKLPSDKRLLLFGANRTGKTLISKEIDKYYTNKNGYYSLLFNKDILSTNFISSSDNTLIVTPFANEKRELENQIKKYQEEFELDTLLKKVFNEKASSAYSYFENIKDLFDNKILQGIYGIEKGLFIKSCFYTENYDFRNYYELEFIKKSLKKETGILRFLDLIKKMNSEKVFNKISKVDDIFKGITPEEYSIKEKIIKDKLNNCPICYSNISDENKKMILEDLNKAILDNDVKKSFIYYTKKDKLFTEIFLSFIQDYKSSYNSFLEKMNSSIMHYLISSIDIKRMKDFNIIIAKYKNINEQSEKFYLSQENKNSNIYTKIKKEFDIFNKYTNSNFSFEIKDGKLELISKEKNIQDLSLSEQKLLQFIYFRILFLQHIEETKDRIIVTIDDPFDSYDDVYVYNMVNIIFKLIKIYNSNIEKFIVLSHNMISLQLLNDEFTKKDFSFSFYWLDILKNSNEIFNIKDNFKIMKKIDQNISSFGLPTMLIEKMIDPYSLIVFSAILRENSQFNCYISKHTNKTVEKNLKIHNKYYNIISERINHNRKNWDIHHLFRINNKLYGYPNCISKFKTIREVFEKLPKNYYDLELIQSKNKTVLKGKDLINLFVWKYLCVLKIRRVLERKLFFSLNKPEYKTLSDLIKQIDTKKPNKLYDFYLEHKNIFNAFNHSSSEIIPPILIYHASYISEVLEKVENL